MFDGWKQPNRILSIRLTLLVFNHVLLAGRMFVPLLILIKIKTIRFCGSKRCDAMCAGKINEVVHLEIENRNDENGKREMDTRDMIYRIASHRIASHRNCCSWKSTMCRYKLKCFLICLYCDLSMSSLSWKLHSAHVFLSIQNDRHVFAII